MKKGSRVVAGIGMIVGSSIVAFGVYVVGMILLSFAGGTHGGSNVPRAFELTMLLLWPAALAVTAVLPGTLLLATDSWAWPLRVAIGCGFICLVWWFIGMGLMMSYGSQAAPTQATPAPLPPPTAASVEHVNRFSVTSEDCKGLGLPPVDFALSWPDHVQRVPNTKAASGCYIMLQRLDESGVIREELEVRSAPGIRSMHDPASGMPHPENVFFDELVEQTKTNLGRDYEMDVFHSSWERLTTGRRIQAQRRPTAAPSQPRAILQFVLAPPAPGEHGLHIIMRAFEASHVDNCMGFENVGMPQQVLAAFHWSPASY